MSLLICCISDCQDPLSSYKLWKVNCILHFKLQKTFQGTLGIQDPTSTGSKISPCTFHDPYRSPKRDPKIFENFLEYVLVVCCTIQVSCSCFRDKSWVIFGPQNEIICKQMQYIWLNYITLKSFLVSCFTSCRFELANLVTALIWSLYITILISSCDRLSPSLLSKMSQTFS